MANFSSFPVARLVMPYSDKLNPCRRALSLRLILCCLLPVKHWSVEPNEVREALAVVDRVRQLDASRLGSGELADERHGSGGELPQALLEGLGPAHGVDEVRPHEVVPRDVEERCGGQLSHEATLSRGVARSDGGS